MSSTVLSRLAAVLAALAIAAGAFGAHALKTLLHERGMTEVWEKAVFYHLIHAVALWVLAERVTRTPAAGWLWLTGLLGFSGSLYGLALVKWSWLGPITPLGGTCLIAGWVVLAFQKGKSENAR